MSSSFKLSDHPNAIKLLRNHFEDLANKRKVLTKEEESFVSGWKTRFLAPVIGYGCLFGIPTYLMFRFTLKPYSISMARFVVVPFAIVVGCVQGAQYAANEFAYEYINLPESPIPLKIRSIIEK